MQPCLTRRRPLRVYFPTTKYPYGVPGHLFHLFFTISFAIFHHGSRYLPTTVVINRYPTSPTSWFINFKLSGTSFEASLSPKLITIRSLLNEQHWLDYCCNWKCFVETYASALQVEVKKEGMKVLNMNKHHFGSKHFLVCLHLCFCNSYSLLFQINRVGNLQCQQHYILTQCEFHYLLLQKIMKLKL